MDMRLVRISPRDTGDLVRPTIRVRGMRKSCGGGSMPGTRGTLAAMMPLWARYMHKGDFPVLDMPTMTTSASLRMEGFPPSSAAMVYSTARTRRKYSLSIG